MELVFVALIITATVIKELSSRSSAHGLVKGKHR
jgi:phage-related holin